MRAVAAKDAPAAGASIQASVAHARIGRGEAAGKVLLLGEHAVVYGARAVAVPLPLATSVTAQKQAEAHVRVTVPAWQVDTTLRWDAEASGLHQPLACILRRLQLQDARLHLHVTARVPRAMGLGSSASLAVATLRALSELYQLKLDDAAVNTAAYAAESVTHGQASGVDNTLATYGVPLMFRRGEKVQLTPLRLKAPLHLVVGQTRQPSLTSTTVAQVAAAHTAQPALYQNVFAAIDEVAQVGRLAVESGDLSTLGVAMNLNHGYLTALEVSTPALQAAINVARRAGALGAKLTGGGGGGSMVALCPGDTAQVARALEAAGFVALPVVVPACSSNSPSRQGVSL